MKKDYDKITMNDPDQAHSISRDDQTNVILEQGYDPLLANHSV